MKERMDLLHNYPTSTYFVDDHWDKCAELEAKYPECDDNYEGENTCEPSEEDVAYYEEHCEDEEEGTTLSF